MYYSATFVVVFEEITLPRVDRFRFQISQIHHKKGDLFLLLPFSTLHGETSILLIFLMYGHYELDDSLFPYQSLCYTVLDSGQWFCISQTRHSMQSQFLPSRCNNKYIEGMVSWAVNVLSHDCTPIRKASNFLAYILAIFFELLLTQIR